jgi:uncharacterized protein YndB with AHSA1/START domain
VLIIAALVNASPAEYRVSRSATIDAPAAKVFAVMNDFEKFNEWSPWKKLDPSAGTTVGGARQGNGATFEWSGGAVGAGKMTILDSKPNEHIKIRLEFSRPFEATCATEFTFKADGAKTIVTWSMSGERDLMQKSFAALMDMEKMLGAQFDEGLRNLGQVVEGKK